MSEAAAVVMSYQHYLVVVTISWTQLYLADGSDPVMKELVTDSSHSSFPAQEWRSHDILVASIVTRAVSH